jgi:hypothetical protein
VLTGGGDCPGLNAVIRAVVRKGVQVYGDEFVGFRDGWRGPLEGDSIPLDVAAVRGILPRGGTILGSSRTNPYTDDNGERRILDTVTRMGVEGLVVVGGEDTLGVATKLAAIGLPVVGVPKTIDNDLGATDYTFGFDTAVLRPVPPIPAPDGFLFLDREDSRVFAGDLSPAGPHSWRTPRFSVASRRSVALSKRARLTVKAELVSLVTDDRMIPLPAQRQMAER